MKQVSIFVLVLLIGAVVLGVAGNGPAAQRSSVPRVASQPADYSPAYLAARNQPHWCGTNEVWEMRKAEQQLIAPEAMACATAVVASDVGGIPEVVSDRQTGLLVHYDAGDPQFFEARLADAVNSLVADPQRARQYGEAGRQR